MAISDSGGNLRGRLAAIGLSVVLLPTLFIPAASIDENKAPPEAPELTVEAIANGTLLGQFRDFIGADFVLKQFAVETFARAHLAFGSSPTPQIFLGEDGEPFLVEDFSNACKNILEDLDFVATVDELSAAQELANRDFLFAIVPDKSSIKRDKLGPQADALLACSDRNRAYLEAIPSLVTGWDSFADSKGELYLFGDTHWNFTGASVFAVDVLEGLQPGIVQPGDLVETETHHTGDLFSLMGLKRLESVTVVKAQREGVETKVESEVTPSGATVTRWQSSGDVAFVPGRTLMVMDSMFGYNRAVYTPYFEDITSIPINALTEPGAIASIGDYDRVIVQRVQRGLPDELGDLDALLSGDWL